MGRLPEGISIGNVDDEEMLDDKVANDSFFKFDQARPRRQSNDNERGDDEHPQVLVVNTEEEEKKGEVIERISVENVHLNSTEVGSN